MARGLMALGGGGGRSGGRSGGEQVGTVASSSGALLLLCMIIMSLSIISMVIFACGDGSKASTSPRKEKRNDPDDCGDCSSLCCGDGCVGGRGVRGGGRGVIGGGCGGGGGGCGGGG